MLAVVIALYAVPVPAGLQAQGKAPAYTPPKNAIGQPDLSGIWQISDTSLAFNVEAHTGSYKMPAGQGAIVDPPDGMIPYLPAARARQRENFKNRAKLDPVEKCYKPGVPRINFMHFPFQIVQTPQYITFVYEYIHNSRIINLNRKTHWEGLDFWNGDSVGRFDGNTLVVDVSHFNGQQWLDSSGNHNSEALKVVERYTRTDPDTITYEVTLEDPKVYSRPWKMTALFYRHKERNFRVLEYECHAYAEDAAQGIIR
jgi:hypothetical protein